MIALSLLAGCSSGNARFSAVDGDTLQLDYAENLEIIKYNNFTVATIRNPWDTTAVLNRYILVADSAELPASLPEGTVVRTPLKRGVVYSSVHIGLLDEIGAGEVVKGVCDSKYIVVPGFSEKISSGDVADCGIGTSPSIEKIISVNPDAIMLSPFENSGNYGKVGQLGIPIIECADYMEQHPLGRAEWMKFYGMLVGHEQEAEDLFARVQHDYNLLKATVDSCEIRPKVLIDRLYGQSWYVPGHHSTMATFIRDAGGENPFDAYEINGSVPLSAEKVLHEAADADVWLIRYSQSTDMTMSQLAADNTIYTQFKAFKDNNVYGCNTTSSLYYARVPFHPSLLLHDIISAVHPEMTDGVEENTYFKKLK